MTYVLWASEIFFTSKTYGRSDIILGILLQFGTASDFIINVDWGSQFLYPVILSYILVYLRLVDEEISFCYTGA